ncbi:hypothetical protein Tco_0445366 [Tanacetum coccineum]
MSKEVGTPRYLSLVVPLKKVGDEAVHKELGDRMERAATTTSSLEFLLLVYFTAAKLMLGSVNAVRHMLMLPVQVPAAEVNPIIYTSCIEQFWATTKVQTVNRVSQLQALVDKKRVIVTESSIKRDLHLDDAEVFLNQQLGDMSTHKKIFVNSFHTKKVFANMKRAGKDFSRRITPLFATMMVQASEEVGKDSGHPTDSTQEAEVSQDETEHEESVPTPSTDPQPSGEDSMQLTDLMVLCTKLQTQVLDLEKAKDAQGKEIAALRKRIQRLERKKMSRPTGLKRLKKVGMSRRVESSKDQESLGAPEDASKQGRILDTDEMLVEAKVDEKDEQSTKLDDSTAGEAVTTASVEDSVAPTTIEEITLAQTLIQIKAAKPKVVTTAATTTTTTRPKANSFCQTTLSQRQRKSYDGADRFTAERLQTREREELIDEEKGKLFMELIEKRRKHFAELRAQEKRNRPPTKAHKRTQMSTYLKHMGGYKHKQLMGKSYDEIKKLFDKEMKRVNTFVAMSSEAQESNEKKEECSKEKAKGNRKKMLGRKRAGKEQQQESSKKQRMEEDK